MKPGWKTTEFWASAAAALVPLANQAFGLHLDPQIMTTIAVGVAGYALSRGIAKHGTTTPVPPPAPGAQ